MSSRHSRSRRCPAIVSMTTLIVVLVAGPASAHPFFRGGEAPIESLASLTLAMGHGCASETAGAGEPTTEVSLEVPDWMRIVDVDRPIGWSVALEEADGRVEVVTWTADIAEEPAPEFDLEVVVSGEVGDERYVRVFQACGDLVERWIGTPDEPADDPAIRLTLVAADPDSPAPPEATPEPEPAPDDGGGQETDELADAGVDGAESGVDPDEAGEGAEEEPAVDAAAADPGDEAASGWVMPLVVVMLVLVLALGLGAWWRARRARSTEPMSS